MRVVGNLLIIERDSGPVYYAKWRLGDGTQIKRRLGPAWLKRDRDGWKKRRGRVSASFLDERAAVVAMDRLIREHAARLAVPKPKQRITFADAATAWLRHLRHIEGE